MQSEGRQYPQGTGWVVGFTLGVVFGVVAWLLSGETTIGLVLLVATGTALGAAFEQSLETHPPTARGRRLVWLLAVLGVVCGLIVLFGVVWLR